LDTLEAFREDKKRECESAVRKGLSLRLVQQKRVRQLISQQDHGLPETYEEYLNSLIRLLKLDTLKERAEGGMLKSGFVS